MNHCADMTLFYLGQIPAIYTLVNENVGSNINSLFYSGIQDPRLICSFREQDAIRRIKSTAAKTGKEEVDVLLIYGRGHDFENIIKALNDDILVFKKNIETDGIFPEISKDYLELRMTQAIDMLNAILGEEFSKKYGAKWIILIDSKTEEAHLKLNIFGNREKMAIFDEIKDKLDKSQFNKNYSISKDLFDKKYDEWCIKLLIINAHLALAQVTANQLKTSLPISGSISQGLRNAINNKTLEKYLSQNELSYEAALQINRDQALRKNLSASDYASIIVLHPNILQIILKNTGTIKKITDDPPSLLRIATISSDITMDLIKDQNFRNSLNDDHRECILEISCKYLEAAKEVISDINIWVNKVGLKSSDLVEIAKYHKDLCENILNLKDWREEDFITGGDRQILLDILEKNNPDVQSRY